LSRELELAKINADHLKRELNLTDNCPHKLGLFLTHTKNTIHKIV
jgi:hypothetical protein